MLLFDYMIFEPKNAWEGMWYEKFYEGEWYLMMSSATWISLFFAIITLWFSHSILATLIVLVVTFTLWARLYYKAILLELLRNENYFGYYRTHKATMMYLMSQVGWTKEFLLSSRSHVWFQEELEKVLNEHPELKELTVAD